MGIIQWIDGKLSKLILNSGVSWQKYIMWHCIIWWFKIMFNAWKNDIRLDNVMTDKIVVFAVAVFIH
jgi:hypothetical protein